MPRAAFIVFATYLSLAIAWPVLPYKAISLGANPQIVTLLLASDTLVILLAAPLLGSVSDRVGRKPVILAGLALQPLAYALMAWAGSIETLFVSRLFAGLGNAAAIPALLATMADQTSDHQRIDGMAAFNGAYGLAFIVGPLLAHQASGAGGEDFATVAWLAMAVAAATWLAGALVPDGGRPATTDGDEQTSAGLSRLLDLRFLLEPRRGIPIAVMVAVGFVFSKMDATIGVWSARVLDWGARDLALAYTAAGSAAVLTQFFVVARLTRRFGEHRVAEASIVAVIAGMALLAFVPTPATTAAAMVLLGAGAATACSCLATLYSRATPAHMQGLVMGTADAAYNGAWVLGPLWGGFCLTFLGNASAYISGVAIAAVALLVLTRLRRAGRASTPAGSARPG